MIIDAHQHVFWHKKNDADLIADMDAHRIDFAWVLTWEIPPHDARNGLGVFNPAAVTPEGYSPGMTLAELLTMRDRYPDRVVVGYCPDPTQPEAPDMFEAAYHMHGARVCGEWKFRVLMDDPRCLNLFRRAGRLGCPVLFHIDIPYLPDGKGGRAYSPYWYGGTMDNVQRAMEACPETIFIGHAPGFWREISADADGDTNVYPKGRVVEGGRLIGALGKYPNLYADLSAGSGRFALQRDPAHARKFLTRFADRLLFGRDYYGTELHDFLRTVSLPKAVRDKIYFKNALRLAGRPLGGKSRRGRRG
jgi:predicted TIM-barrel fold metal-dependent hydrolase